MKTIYLVIRNFAPPADDRTFTHENYRLPIRSYISEEKAKEDVEFLNIATATDDYEVVTIDHDETPPKRKRKQRKEKQEQPQ